jgi:glyoxylase-like metal-dependent hydrolase (beta-lactamase superfamily II)
VLGSVHELGFGVDDIRGIVLTHAHVDHFGTAIWFAQEHGIPVYCHPDEVGHAKREYLEQVSPLDLARNIWKPAWAAWMMRIMRVGALTSGGIPSAQALTGDMAATLPGNPMPIPTPGHTGGHCSFIVNEVLISGDALVTGHPVARHDGPQLLPSVFNHDEAGCERSLSASALLETEVLVPGHGPVWRGPIRDAVAQALR